MNKLKVIITGATGMIGEGVLYESLNHTEVEKVLVLTRKSSGYSHPKLTEIIHDNFLDFSSVKNRLVGFNACYYCIGVTSLGKSEDEYTRQTYTMTMNLAEILVAQNPDMTFCFISGQGTDSSGKSRNMWARVKGKTENDLAKLPFKGVYSFRPGGIEPFLPLKPSQTYYKTYKYMGWLFSLMKIFVPGMVVKMKDLAASMINASLIGYSATVLEMKDIKILAKTKV